MKRLLLLGVLSLSACQMPDVQSTPSDPLSHLKEITQADLITTLRIANAVKPPDQMAIQCVTYLQGLLAPSDGTTGFIPPTGIASTFETARLGIRMGTGAMSSSAQNDALLIACGPLAISVGNDVVHGALALTNLGSFPRFLLSLLPIVGSIQGVHTP